MQPRKIFLSYRREDSAGEAGRLNDRLVSELGNNSVFMDVDGIPLGTDFVKRLTAEVASCDVLLAIIGKTGTASASATPLRRSPDSGTREKSGISSMKPIRRASAKLPARR